MNFISLDLEFNGAFDFGDGKNYASNEACKSEIIQIGAVMLNESLKITNEFNAYIKPKIYPKINPFISDVIKMKTADFENCGDFKTNYLKFKRFLGDEPFIFIVWGDSDIPTLYENLSCYKLISEPLILKYMNIQPIVGCMLNNGSNQQISLKNAIEALEIPTDSSRFHNALYDAYYTAQIFKKLNLANSAIKIFCSNHYKNLKK